MLLVAKVYKSLAGRSSTGQWSNTYEFESDNAIGSPELDAEVDKFVAFERSLHTSVVHFMRVVVSTFAEEGKGHPEAVRVRELAGTGAIAAGVDTDSDTNVLPAEVVLEVKRIATTGRTGRLLYRGALTERDVRTMGNGKFALPAIQLAEKVAITDAWNADADKPNMVLASGDGQSAPLTRPVSRLEIGSVIVRKRTSRKKKKEEVKSEEGLMQYMDEAMGILAAVAMFAITKGKGISPTARAYATASAAGIGDVIGDIIQYVTADPVAPE